MKNKLNEKRNTYMDEIIELEDTRMPQLQRDKREILGKISLVTKKKNILWDKIKGIHIEIKRSLK